MWFLDTVDIGKWLKKGENVIAAAVLRYPEDPAKGNHAMFRTPTPGLYVKGSIIDQAGKTYEVSADESWKYKRNEHVRLIKEEEYFAPADHP